MNMKFAIPITNEELKMAERYKLYLSGFAYIPCQDLAKYEKAYTKVSK